MNVLESERVSKVRAEEHTESRFKRKKKKKTQTAPDLGLWHRLDKWHEPLKLSAGADGNGARLREPARNAGELAGELGGIGVLSASHTQKHSQYVVFLRS